MQVQAINNSNSKAFGAITPDVGMSKEVFDAIVNSKVLKRFGKDFNASASVTYFLGKTTGKPQMALSLDDIKPVKLSLKDKIKTVLWGSEQKKKKTTIYLKTKATNEKGFIETVNSRRSDSLHRIYYNV